jgi:hypothetical protein
MKSRLQFAIALCLGVLVSSHADADRLKKVCNLCNDKGYCLDFANRSACEQKKAIIQKTWDPALKWSCSCSKQAAPSGGDSKAACCWISGNTATKICGKEDKVRKSLIISNPGKSIECAAP